MLLPRPEKLETFRVSFRDGERFDVVAEDQDHAKRSAKAMRPFSQIRTIERLKDQT